MPVPSLCTGSAHLVLDVLKRQHSSDPNMFAATRSEEIKELVTALKASVGMDEVATDNHEAAYANALARKQVRWPGQHLLEAYRQRTHHVLNSKSAWRDVAACYAALLTDAEDRAPHMLSAPIPVDFLSHRLPNAVAKPARA